MSAFGVLLICCINVLFLFYNVNCKKKYYAIPDIIENCDSKGSVEYFQFEDSTLTKNGPHHVILDVPRAILKHTILEPIQAKVEVQRQKASGDWDFYVKSEFRDICTVLALPGTPWTYAMSLFKEGPTLCPLKPIDKPLNNMTFDGDVSQLIEFGEDDVGKYMVTLSGTGIVGLRVQDLGCIKVTGRIEGFDE